MAELADAGDLKSPDPKGRVGSIPTPGTTRNDVISDGGSISYAGRMRYAAVALALLTVAACGGSGGGGTPTSPAVATTDTFSGTAIRTSASGCGGDVHTVTAREGSMSVTLVSTNDPNGGLSIQICQGADTPETCTVAQQRITIGQTLSGERKGTSMQVVKPLPWGCVFGGIDASPVTYTLSVSYLK